MARGENTANHPNRKVSKEALVANTQQNIPSLVEGTEVYADAPEAPVKKKATGTLSKTKANPVTVISDRNDLTSEEQAEHKKFLTDSNIQGRFEAMDRNVSFPLERY